MSRRATFTQAELARAIRAADGLGKVALWTVAGIAFVNPETVEITSPGRPGRNSCDDAFGVTEAAVAECDKAFGISREFDAWKAKRVGRK